MSQYIFMENDTFLPIQTVRILTQAEIDNPVEERARKEFDMRIKSLYGTNVAPPSNWEQRRRHSDDDKLEDDPLWKEDDNGDKDELPLSFVYEDNNGKEHEMPEVDDLEDLDKLVGAEVVLPQNGIEMRAAHVLGRVTDRKGRQVGTYNHDPLLDTHVYEVGFTDGALEQYSANLIAEAFCMECDDEGRRSRVLDRIMECRKGSDALSQDEAFIVDSQGKKS
mmetsp:Transcript_9776/g.13821  ORF Transcript_9776/g.13821 Transcript_9776/m.13821 type:complete len:222 (+) Transcript_9776:32-697(+)